MHRLVVFGLLSFFVLIVIDSAFGQDQPEKGEPQANNWQEVNPADL